MTKRKDYNPYIKGVWQIPGIIPENTSRQIIIKDIIFSKGNIKNNRGTRKNNNNWLAHSSIAMVEVSKKQNRF